MLQPTLPMMCLSSQSPTCDLHNIREGVFSVHCPKQCPSSCTKILSLMGHLSRTPWSSWYSTWQANFTFERVPCTYGDPVQIGTIRSSAESVLSMGWVTKNRVMHFADLAAVPLWGAHRCQWTERLGNTHCGHMWSSRCQIAELIWSMRHDRQNPCPQPSKQIEHSFYAVAISPMQAAGLHPLLVV